MTRLTLDISMSLDGFVAGPNRTVEKPLGDGGDRLHEWIFGLQAGAHAKAAPAARGTPMTTFSGNGSTSSVRSSTKPDG